MDQAGRGPGPERRGSRGRVEVVPVPAALHGAHRLRPYSGRPGEGPHSPPGTSRQCRLICLFGCGGDRDRTKRPRMGEIAAALADLVILTSDNPRTEDPEAILDQVAAGFPPGFTAWVRQPDRRAAIRQALSMGRAGDVILLAGKGHETEQEIGTQRVHLDEREEIASFFQQNTL
ncbi:MAG: glutamate ligase domain-containing protein [Evtepia gabavorous]